MYQITCFSFDEENHTPLVITYRPYLAADPTSVPKALVRELTHTFNEWKAHGVFHVSVYEVSESAWAGPTFSYNPAWKCEPMVKFGSFPAFLNWIK